MAKRSWLILAAGLVLGAGLQFTLAAGAEPAGKVFEIRTYHTFPGRLDALHKRFREHTMKMFEKHGMSNVGYWVPQDSPARETTLIYVISHASREAAKANWAAFIADPEWKKIADASQVDGKIIERIESVYVDATDYSPIK
ncbi:MAG TPA: NIPSNAP family protein [Steroidobacteraceae bacterium]|nr:NIPSNAP family protein [Steroidobacteraceae bacterium]